MAGIAGAGVARALAVVRRRIEHAGGDPAGVTVVAVTKGLGPAAVRAALEAGITDIGENYAQELRDKAGEISPGALSGEPLGEPSSRAPRWHFLGAIQRNKVGRIARLVHLWQGVDRLEEARAISAAAPGSAVLVQVDVTGSAGRRSGRPPDQIPGLVSALRGEGLVVRGLMVMGPPGPPEGSRPGFRRVAALRAELGLAELSMGMTDDLEIAVEEGSTMVRVGRGLFGERPNRDGSPRPPSGARRQ